MAHPKRAEILTITQADGDWYAVYDHDTEEPPIGPIYGTPEEAVAVAIAHGFTQLAVPGIAEGCTVPDCYCIDCVTFVSIT